MFNDQSSVNLEPTIKDITAEPAPELQPKKPKRLRMIALISVFAIAFGGVAWFWLLRHPSESTETATVHLEPLEVETTTAAQESIAGDSSLTGTIESVETVTTTSRIQGQIKNLPVAEGDRVKAGQVLAIIDVKDIQAQGNQALAAIAQAQAGVTVAAAAQTQAMASKTQAEAQLNQAEAGQQQAEAQLQEAAAQLADAQLNQRRMTMLQKDGAVSQSQLDQANTQVALIQARIKQAKAGIEQANRGIDRAKAGVQQASSQVKQAEAGVEQARSQVQQAKAGQQQTLANLNYGTVTAPFAGVITKKHTEVGAIAGPGQPIVTLESTNRLRLSVAVPESLITLVRLGDEVTVQLDTVNRSVTGHVRQIVPSANLNSRSFTVKVALDNSYKLMPGMFGRLELPRETRTVMMIPQNAVFKRGQLAGVYVIAANNTAQLRWVKTGKAQDNKLEIVSGLETGDRIITSNVEELRDGQQVVANK